MAVTTPAATPKPITLNTPTSAELRLPDAIQLLTYLSGRGLLCTSCGYGWVVAENAAYNHCTGCQRPNMTYNPRIGKGSDFERILCNRLGQFVATFLKADKTTASDATNSKSK